MAAAVEIDGLRHFYGRGELRRQVLHDIDAQIASGEIVIVSGPSGSGKTTLLTIIGALRAAQEGQVRVLGEELHGARRGAMERVRRQIGFIFQQHNLMGALTAQQNVELGARVGRVGPLREQRRRAEQILDAVGLGAERHKRPDQLSGGQRQRVAIARALVAQPGMLLADEPTASLDREAGREVVDRMRTLAREQGTTILMVTHDNRILDIADRLLHLEDGHLTTFTESVIADTQHLMRMLAENYQKQSMDDMVADLDESGFRGLLEDFTRESEHFLRSVQLANDEAVQGMLTQSLNAFTRKVAEIMQVERASLFLVDADSESLLLHVSQDRPDGGRVLRIPLDSGIAGAAFSAGETIRVNDAYEDPRFNRSIDEATGFRTRSVLCLPLRNSRGSIFAVAQLLNPLQRNAFDASDEARLQAFLEPLGVILETWQQLRQT
jgi:putative ABC transport system ATP-binding protein